MPPIATFALSLAMLAAFLLAGAGFLQIRKAEPAVRQRGWLMIAMAVILVANVAIWTV